MSSLITVGITCYREGEWLCECWESLLAQTDNRWEAVMILDGNADDLTTQIFRSIEHPRLCKLEMESNEGPYACRNKSFEMTHTPYHFYLDGDDKLPPNVISDFNNILQNETGLDHVYGDCLLIPDEKLVLAPKQMESEYDILASGWMIGITRVDTWRRLGGFAMELNRGGADTDFKIAMYESGCKFRYCKGTSYCYRIGIDNSVSSKRQRTVADVYLTIVKRHPKFFSQRRVCKKFLEYGFTISIKSALSDGDKISSLHYLRRGFAVIGIFNLRFWFYFFRTIFGERFAQSIKRAIISAVKPFSS